VEIFWCKKQNYKTYPFHPTLYILLGGPSHTVVLGGWNGSPQEVVLGGNGPVSYVVDLVGSGPCPLDVLLVGFGVGGG